MNVKPTALIATPYFPPHVGGVENYVCAIGSLLTKYGWKVVVVTSTEGKYSVETFQGMRVYRLPYQFKLSNTPINLRWFWTLKSIIKTERPSLVNVHAPVAFMAEAATSAADHIPVIVTYHAGAGVKGKGAVIDILTKAYESLIAPLTFRRSRRIICSSDFIRNTFLQKYKKKTVTITPGVDTKIFTPRRSKASSILFVGNLNKADRYKELSTLLEAIAILNHRGTKVQLTVIGDGDYRSKYEHKAASLGISVSFRGKLTGKTLTKAYQDCTALAAPSVFESFGMAALEAMSCAKPVIAADTSGLPYLVKHEKNGLLFPAKNASALAEAIERLLTDKQLATRLGKAGRDQAVKQFTWETKAREYDRVLKEVLRA